MTVEFRWGLLSLRDKWDYRNEYIRRAKLYPGFKSIMSGYITSGHFDRDVALLKRAAHDDSYNMAWALVGAGGPEKLIINVALGYIHRHRYSWLIF